MDATAASGLRVPVWFRAVAGVGVLWNIYGVYQFFGSFSQTTESLMAAGMTADQAALYQSLPAWLTVAFAVGVFGGLAGSGLLLARRALALPVLGVSFAGYIALFAGDVGYGVFEDIPSQLAILLVVVLVAAGLLATAIVARKRGLLA